MSTYYFDLWTVWAVIIALLSSMLMLIYSMVTIYYKDKYIIELEEKLKELESEKKLSLSDYINLKARKHGKALPRWILKAMAMNRVK